MLATSQKLLHRARSLRRLHNHNSSSDDSLPPVPTTPTSATFPSASFSTPVDIPMPMPPTAPARPRTHYACAAAADDLQDAYHFRQASSCSHASRASSSWSSNASTTSSSSRNTAIEWDPLRLHPPPMPVVRASPQYDAGRSFYDHEDDYSCTPIQPQQKHGFNFGFSGGSTVSSSSSPRHAVRQTVAGIRLVSSDDDLGLDFDMDDAALQGGLAPPPARHHRLRTHQSEANLHEAMKLRDLQLERAVVGRPSTPPPVPALPTSEPVSPVTPRTQPSAATDSEHYFKRGDWKRRGIVFSGYDQCF